MTRASLLQSFLPAAIALAPSLPCPGEVLAQDRTGQQPGSHLGTAIVEARRSPFHAGLQPAPPELASDAFARLPPAPESRMSSRDGGELAARVFFSTLPAVALLDAFFISAMTRDDEGPQRGSGDFSALRSLGAIVVPALVGRLAGARFPIAAVGSTLGFSSVVMATLLLGRPAFFVAPFLHAGATALLVAAGSR